MYVLITCKFKKYLILSTATRWIANEKKWQHQFLEAQEQLTLWSMVGSGRNSNSSKLLCMPSLSASMKRIWWRTAAEKWQHRFSHHKSMRIFSGRSRAANPAVGSPIRPNFEHLRALMHVIITCKYEKDRMKNSREKSGNTVFPIITLWELTVAMETRVLIRSGSKPNAAFPQSKWCFW